MRRKTSTMETENNPGIKNYVIERNFLSTIEMKYQKTKHRFEHLTTTLDLKFYTESR
jgi:hypothetical protein